jgi:hypothetical protein
MSAKQILTMSLAMTAFGAHIAFAAGAPANIKSVEAELQEETLNVSWSAVDSAAFYRVYFSHASILQNNGDYDDFERTNGSETSYTFTKLPLASDQIFVSVLAVNAEGMESEGFEVEAAVDTAAATPDTNEPVVVTENPIMPEGENPTTTSEPMTMISAEVVSATGILVTFSKNIAVNVDLTPEFFVIADSGGVVLPTTRLTTNAATILFSTEKQTPEKLYIVYILQPLPAGDGTHAPPSGATVTFRGYGTLPPTEPVLSVPPPPVPYGKAPVASIEDPTSLKVTATPRQDGTYDIVARWNPALGAEGYGIYTSIDGGGYAFSSVVPANQTTVRYTKVKPGAFALRLTSKNGQGTESRGIERAIKLPSTGLGLLGIVSAAAVTAGMSVYRRRKTV